MKPILKNALALALPLALAACGGGGGGDNNAPVDTPKPQESAIAKPKNISLHGALAAQLKGQDDFLYSHTNDSSNSRLTTKDGVSYAIPLSADGVKQKGNIIAYKNVTTEDKRSYKTFLVSSAFYDQVQFGLFDSDTMVGGFFRGNLTKTLPKSGVVAYRGDAIVAFANDDGKLLRTEDGTSFALADFGKKSIGVTISSTGYSGMQNGSFGNAAAFGSPENGSKTVVGFFAGENAEEITGLFEDENANVTAIFGAKRQ